MKGGEVTRACEKLAAYKRVKKVTIRDEEYPKITTRKIKRFEVDLLMMDRQQVT